MRLKATEKCCVVREAYCRSPVGLPLEKYWISLRYMPRGVADSPLPWENDNMAQHMKFWSVPLVLLACFVAGFPSGLAGSNQEEKPAQRSGWEKAWSSPGFEASVR